MSKHEPAPFYGKDVIRRQEKQQIEKILSQFKNEPVSDELKEKIWNRLMWEKHLGNITIPFKIVMHKDPQKKFPDTIEVILDSKV